MKTLWLENEKLTYRPDQPAPAKAGEALRASAAPTLKWSNWRNL